MKEECFVLFGKQNIWQVAKLNWIFEGVNVAGKTTTFNMLTGDSEVSAGEAFVNGYRILNDLSQVGGIYFSLWSEHV